MGTPKKFFLLFPWLVILLLLFLSSGIIATSATAWGTILVFSGLILLQKRRKKRQKQRYFEQNGGLLLEKQFYAAEGVVGKTKIFSSKELEKATDGFNESQILGQGGQGTVYKGMLADGRTVAIKKPVKVNKSLMKVDEGLMGQFINELVILSQVNHRNVVKLLGCCLETQVPLLVYEFIPGGTLFNLIHSDNEAEFFPLTWSLRLKIAREVAGALAYLHSGISIPIFHGDVKSSNILLDNEYTAKISDFGASFLIAIDKTHMTTRVQGTFGYIDPEYFQSSQFTEKSDVYSFGVVLLELLTRQKPTSSTGEGEDYHLGLAQRFLLSMEKNCLSTILDPQILDRRNEEEVTAVAKLAQRCINWCGRSRPTMKEVAIELENIKMSKGSATIQENYPSPSCINEEAVVDIYHTWTVGTENVTSTSVAYAVLNNTI